MGQYMHDNIQEQLLNEHLETIESWIFDNVKRDFLKTAKCADSPFCFWRGAMILRFFPVFRHVAAPWWPNTEIIWLKSWTLIDFIICHNFAIHCACKLWTGMMIFRFFTIFRHIDAPWWPNTQINITEM